MDNPYFIMQNQQKINSDYTHCEKCFRVLYRAKIGKKTLIKTVGRTISDVKIFSILCTCGRINYFNPVDSK